jgi:short-chain fatty acids transporter
MSASQHFERVFRKLMPGPFGLAILLTAFAAVASLVYGNALIEIGEHWQRGFWDSSLLVFTFQMALILILGYSIAVSPLAERYIEISLKQIPSQGIGVVVLSLSSMLLCWINWGLGLIIGAIMAKKLADSFHTRKIPFHYPLLGAAGYVGMMTWHSGLSGSAPLKAAEQGHLQELSGIANLPDYISVSHTIFSYDNLISFGIILVLIPLFLLVLARNKNTAYLYSPPPSIQLKAQTPQGAERFEFSKWVAMILGMALLAVHIYPLLNGQSSFGPNYLNGIFLGLAMLLHGSIAAFFRSVKAGMDGAAAILIQFPFYFGIMGILKYGNLISEFTEWFLVFGNNTTMPFLIMSSSAIVNFFVPSGGGQWAVQGPLIISICESSGLALEKGVMAMAYGDQLTNMLQPFWALPLLSITKLKAHQVLPYTTMFMIIGMLIYGVVLFFAA